MQKPVTLIGQHVILESLTENHRETLRPIAQDERLWTFSPANGLGKNFNRWFDKALSALQNGQAWPYVVYQKATQQIIGATRYYDIELQHKRLTIGYTWYIPSVWGTVVNIESKFLLLKQAFKNLKINHVKFTIDSRNKRSIAAVKKIGATQEGILYQHMVLDDGYIRDTVVLSIAKTDWPEIKLKLQERLM